MARDLNKIIIVDIEATCWEKRPPKGEESEIIEIGAVLFGLNSKTILETKTLLCKPQRSRVSEFCTNLTTITQEQLDREGISFRDACKQLSEDWNSADYTWASWGDYDRTMFERQCRNLHVDYPFGKTHINVKNMFAILEGYTREFGVANTMDKLGLKFQGTEHRGIDDAKNITVLFSYLLQKYKE